MKGTISGHSDSFKGGIENRVTNGDNFQTYSIHVPGLGYVFNGSECRIRHEANSQLKFWIAGMGALMQTYLKPNEKMVGYIGGRIYSPLGFKKSQCPKKSGTLPLP
ncbi:hypothetical protein T06_13468 [Trichinella sp. T6]|nr:hypothetical protein T06_13468 [Trichinella sp. T6]